MHQSFRLRGAIMQEWQPIAFTRKALNTTKKCHAEIEKKLLLIVHACM